MILPCILGLSSVPFRLRLVDANNFISNSINTIKKQFPDIILIADVALDPYTDHGHDGVVHGGIVDNDLTLDKLISNFGI